MLTGALESRMQFRSRLVRLIDNENCSVVVGPQPSFYRASDIAAHWRDVTRFYPKSYQVIVTTSFFLVANGNYKTEKIGAEMACLGNLDSHMISIT